MGRKLWKSNDGLYCFGHSGFMDSEAEKFIQQLVNGGFDVRSIVGKASFPELREPNIKRMGQKLPDQNLLSSLLLATRFDDLPQLWTCFPLGSVESREWVPIGSGQTKVDEYMQARYVLGEAMDYLPRKNLRLRDVIRLGLEAVRRAQAQDVYSHWLDLLVCMPDGIRDHHAQLGDDFGRKLRSVLRQYK